VGLAATVTTGDDGTVIYLAGELDMSTGPTLREAVHANLPGRAGRLVLDLSELTFCGSLGLGTLLVLSRTARSQSTLLVLRHLSPTFARMVEVAGVSSAFTIAAD
jgi:anti-anti-sigma factor